HSAVGVDPPVAIRDRRNLLRDVGVQLALVVVDRESGVVQDRWLNATYTAAREERDAGERLLPRADANGLRSRSSLRNRGTRRRDRSWRGRGRTAHEYDDDPAPQPESRPGCELPRHVV